MFTLQWSLDRYWRQRWLLLHLKQVKGNLAKTSRVSCSRAATLTAEAA